MPLITKDNVRHNMSLLRRVLQRYWIKPVTEDTGLKQMLAVFNQQARQFKGTLLRTLIQKPIREANLLELKGDIANLYSACHKQIQNIQTRIQVTACAAQTGVRPETLIYKDIFRLLNRGASLEVIPRSIKCRNDSSANNNLLACLIRHRTNEIVLREPTTDTDISLGRMIIEYDMCNSPSCENIKIRPDGKEVYDKTHYTFHPHVSSNRLCFGDHAAFVTKQLQQGAFVGAFCLTEDILSNYGTNPYIKLENWLPAKCFCGRITRQTCVRCGKFVCEDHAIYITFDARSTTTDNPYCIDCIKECERCGAQTPENHLTYCTICGKRVCRYCLTEQGTCYDCIKTCSVCGKSTHQHITCPCGNITCLECIDIDLANNTIICRHCAE
jgi:hypothetical protein